jgi:uncharacterized protein
VVIELKQWSAAEQYEDDATLVLVDGYPHHPRLHPVAQVHGYCDYLVGFTRVLQNLEDPIAGAAYLHNANDDSVNELFNFPEDRHGRLFTGQRRGEFVAFLRDRLDPEVPGAPFADELLTSAVAPSIQLLKVAADEIRDREQFVLLTSRLPTGAARGRARSSRGRQERLNRTLHLDWDTVTVDDGGARA